MGQRTIDTVLRVQGENEYKSALKNCNAELKVMKSELDKVTSDYRTNANSMEALTKKGEVLSKMYDAQQQKVELLRGAMSKAEETRDAEGKKVAELREQYAQAQKTLKTYGDEMGETSEEYKEQQTAVEKLRDDIIQHQAKLESSTRSYQSYATQLNKAEIELNDLSDQQEENNRLLEEAKQSADGCATSIDRYGDAVKESGDSTGKTTSALEAMASAMVASGIQQKVEDLAAAMMECSRASQSFEHSVAQVSTIADESVMSSSAMKAGIMELSTELRKDANEVANATYNALSAGVETAGVLDFVRQSSQLATAGFTDMGTSVDVLTTILNAYKLEADNTEKVASTLVATQNLGKITVADLGKVLGRIIPSAAAYKVNLDNIAAAYANMTAAGINAENTTTYLSTMMDELADSGSNVAAILQQQTGKTFTELMEDGASLGDVLDVLGASVAYDNTQFSNLFASATAAKGAVALFNGSADAFNATLTKMANSSGTVAQNYEKMVDASEYSSQRLQVATSNLKIAVGDQLNPVLDKLREKGAGALEVATGFVQEHPSVVAAISGVVTSLGLLASGLSALMIAKTVKNAIDALNISLSANPAVMAAVAIAGVVTALGVYIAQIETTQEKVDALTESARNLSDTVAAGNTAYDDAVVSAEAAAGTVGQYIDRLAELEAQGKMTDAQQQEYAILLDKIRSLIPGINIDLDDETRLLKGGTDALREQADAWKQNAIVQAAYARYKDDAAALDDALFEVAKNQAKLNILEKENQPTKDRLAQVTEELRKAQERLNNTTVAGSDYLGASSREQMDAQKQVEQLTAEYNQLQVQMRDVNAEEGVLRQAIQAGEQTISDCRAEVEAADEAYKSLASSTETASEDTADATADMAESVDEHLQELKASYDELYASAKNSLDTQIGLFDDLSGKCKTSTADMIKNLQSQITAFNDYSANIELAMARGIDIGLVQKLSDGSAESMKILAELVTGTDIQISVLNAAFNQSEAAKAGAAETMSAVNKAYSDGLDKISSDWFKQWRQLGENASDELSSGYASRAQSLMLPAKRLSQQIRLEVVSFDQSETAKGAAEKTMSAVKPVYKAGFVEISEDWREQQKLLVRSSEEMAKDVEASLQELKASYDELYGAAKNSLDNQVGLFDAISGKCETSTADMIKNLQSQITAYNSYSQNIQLALDRGIDFEIVKKLSDGSTKSMQILAELVTGTDGQIAELNAAFDQSEAAKEGAAETMSAVNKAYSDGLDEISSDWFDQWKLLGQQSADGLIAGFESRIPLVMKTAAKVSDAGQTGFKKESQINSPSKKWMWLAEQEVAAPLLVYKQAIPKMEAQARELSDAGYLGAIRSKQAAIPSLVSAASAIPAGSDNSRLYQLLQQILAGIQAGKKLVLYPDVLVGETVDSYDAALGYNKMLTDRGAK